MEDRVFVSSGRDAENDKGFIQAVYLDVTGSLTIGMPVYVNELDAGELNDGSIVLATALNPAAARTAGSVCLGNTAKANGANAFLVGIFYPNNVNEKPVNGGIIRICRRGICPVAAEGVGGVAVNVGSNLIGVPGTTNFVRTGAAALKVQVGAALATGAAVALGNQIVAAAGAAAVINAWVDIR